MELGRRGGGGAGGGFSRASPRGSRRVVVRVRGGFAARRRGADARADGENRCCPAGGRKEPPWHLSRGGEDLARTLTMPEPLSHTRAEISPSSAILGVCAEAGRARSASGSRRGSEPWAPEASKAGKKDRRKKDRAPETTGTRDAFETELARGRAARARLGRGARGNRAANAPFLRSSSEKRRRARRSLGVGSERARGPNGVSRRGGAKRSGRWLPACQVGLGSPNTFGRSRSNARRRDFTGRFDGQSVGRRGKPDPIGLRA